jgi:NADH dehydrogenase FAD-containing subunit
MARAVVLGAGFAGLELATILSEELGERAGVTLIDEGRRSSSATRSSTSSAALRLRTFAFRMSSSRSPA